MIKSMYQTPLLPGTTLCVYEGDSLIFSSRGKWLMPLFELEDFLSICASPRQSLSVHDTAVGKAAAVIMVRLGITRIHANLVSERARAYIDDLNAKTGHERIFLTFERQVPKLLCATEDILESMTDQDSMYGVLRQRANKARASSVPLEHRSCS